MIPPEVVTQPLSSFLYQYKIVICLIMFLIAVAYVSVAFLGKNNVVEIEIEKVIEAESGLKMDLTP